MSFEGKVILITGASSGIGRACAEYFAKEGALLSLVGRNAEKFETVLEQITESGVDVKPLVILADISVDFTRIMDETIEKYGRLDILINNAGFSIPSSIENTKIEEFDGNRKRMDSLPEFSELHFLFNLIFFSFWKIQPCSTQMFVVHFC